MIDAPQGPVAAEIHRRLTAALSPERLVVTDDSEKHRGHAGHDARGESHFTVEVTAAMFAGQSRVARQRAVNAALKELLVERVHALAIIARAPGEDSQSAARAPGEDSQSAARAPGEDSQSAARSLGEDSQSADRAPGE